MRHKLGHVLCIMVTLLHLLLELRVPTECSSIISTAFAEAGHHESDDDVLITIACTFQHCSTSTLSTLAPLHPTITGLDRRTASPAVLHLLQKEHALARRHRLQPPCEVAAGSAWGAGAACGMGGAGGRARDTAAAQCRAA